MRQLNYDNNQHPQHDNRNGFGNLETTIIVSKRLISDMKVIFLLLITTLLCGCERQSHYYNRGLIVMNDTVELLNGPYPCDSVTYTYMFRNDTLHISLKDCIIMKSDSVYSILVEASSVFQVDDQLYIRLHTNSYFPDSDTWGEIKFMVQHIKFDIPGLKPNKYHVEADIFGRGTARFFTTP